MKKFIKNNYLLIIIIAIAAVLRFIYLNSIPISLNIDETALGYNSYSILLTGRDEYGQIPFMLKSFGDWKVPGYALITTIPIWIFDLNEFSVRLPSAVSGLMQVILIYFISLKIFKRKSIALLSSLFLAVSPWSIYFSRIAYEVNLATTFFMIGFLGLLKYLDDVKKYKKFILLSSIFFSLTIITYHAYIIFTPLFVVSAVIYLRKYFYKNIFLILAIFIFVLTSFSYLYITSQTMSKFSDVSIFNDENIIDKRINVFRTDNSNVNLVAQKALHNKYTGLTYHVGQNYVNSFSPSFLFDKGGEKFLHNIGTMGNLYLIDALFLVFGLIYLHKYKNNKLMLVLIWLILAPIPSAMTKDTPSSTRLFIMLIPLMVFISLGAYQLFELLIKKKIMGKLLIFGISVAFLINVIYFLDAYFTHMNYQRASYLHYGFEQMVDISNKFPDKKIVVFGPENFPYISFLFYNKYDPLKFRENVNYYPENYANFVNVKSFDRYSFVDEIDYENIREDTIYFDYRGIRDEDYKINYPSGEAAFKYFTKE